MSTSRFAFIKAGWHSEIVDAALAGFVREVGESAVEVFDVPGAFEIPLFARDLAATGRFDAIVGCAFVVDGGIYRHEFVASTVLDGMMRAQLDASVPVLSVVLTPHNYQETAVHDAFFKAHFVEKGLEAGRAAKSIVEARAAIAVGAAGAGRAE